MHKSFVKKKKKSTRKGIKWAEVGLDERIKKNNFETYGVCGLDVCGSGHDLSRLKEAKKLLLYSDGQYNDQLYHY
jgi:hypothetical protein